MLKWQFEHFKTFTPYNIMVQAAAILLQYEGENTDGSNPRMSKMTRELIANTGHPAWTPNRDTGNLDINTEGSVFRNKARLFSSFYICVPPELLVAEGKPKKIFLTEFGRALGQGRVSEKEFYRFIVQRFMYPHPSFDDYEEWVESGNTIRPLLLIIKTLVALFEKAGKNFAYLTANEIYEYLQPLTDENPVKAVQEIIKARNTSEISSYSTDDLRKISEMLAFLSIAGYVIIDGTQGDTRYYLNLISRHPNEKTLFYLQRNAGGAGTGTKKVKIDLIEEYKKLWE